MIYNERKKEIRKKLILISLKLKNKSIKRTKSCSEKKKRFIKFN